MIPILSAAIGGGNQEGASAPFWTFPRTGAGASLRAGDGGRGTACGRFAAHAGDEGRARTLRCAPGTRDEGRETGAGALLRARGREMRVRKEAGTGLVPASLKVDGSAGGSAYFFARWSARAILATWPLRTSRASRLGMTMRPLNISLMSQTRLTFWTEPTTMKARAMRA